MVLACVVIAAVIRQAVALLLGLAVQELNSIRKDAYFTAVLPIARLVVALLQSALHQNLRTLAQELLTVSGTLAEYLNANKQRFLAVVSAIVGVFAAVCQPEVADFGSAGKVFDLRIVDEIAGNESLVNHFVAIAPCLRNLGFAFFVFGRRRVILGKQRVHIVLMDIRQKFVVFLPADKAVTFVALASGCNVALI